jgi:hypothetical protein
MLRSVAVLPWLAAAAHAGAPATSQPPPTPTPMMHTAPMPMPPGPPPPPPVPTPPPPPAEIGALAKQVAGSYACKGVQFVGNGSSTPLAAKLTVKLALGGAWIVSSLVETKTDGLSFDDYRTYDDVAKQWTRVQLASTTGHVIWTSLGDKSGTWTWEGTATSPQGTQQVRDYEQPGDHQLKLWGEALLGGSWQKLYEVTCKR